MKKIIFSLFIIFYTALAQKSCKYTKLSSETVEESAVIKDLRELGKEFVISQGMYHAPKSPLPHKIDFGIVKTYSVERKVSNDVYYFRYKVLIAEGESADPEPEWEIIINATYTVSFSPSNGKVSVTSYHYSVRFPDTTMAVPSDSPFYGEPTLDDAPSDDDVDYVVEHAIKDGSLKEGKYSVGKIYRDYMAEDNFYHDYLLTLVRTDGYTVRAQIILDSGGGTQDNYDIKYVIYTNDL